MIMYQRKYLPHPLPQQEQPYQWTGSLLSLWLSKQTVQRYQWPYPNLHYHHHHHVILLQKKGKFTQLHCLSLGQHLVDVVIIILVGFGGLHLSIIFSSIIYCLCSKKVFLKHNVSTASFLKIEIFEIVNVNVAMPNLRKGGTYYQHFSNYFYIDGILKSHIHFFYWTRVCDLSALIKTTCGKCVSTNVL